MNCCNNSQCVGIENTFDDHYAVDDLKRYRKDGPSATTMMMLDALKSQSVRDETLLDIGGGVGAISHVMLEGGMSKTICVDASSAYTKVAKKEALRRGLEDKITFNVGNFLDLALELEPVEVVTLDRVICCFNDMDSLVKTSAGKAKKYYGLVYPRYSIWIRAGVSLFNLFQSITKKQFRIFAHPTKAVEAILFESGLKRIFHHRGLFWQVAVFQRL